MTKILDLSANPVLGRVHAVNRKHRLRSKHWADVDDWPDTGGTVDLLDRASLETLDFYPNRDQVFLCSSKLLNVLGGLHDGLQSFELDAGGRTVHLVLPLTNADVMYQSEGFPTYSKSGYDVVDGHNLRVVEEPKAPFCAVRNTGLLAISDELVAAAEAASVRWTLYDAVAHYAPMRRHPYFVYGTGNGCARAAVIEAATPWPPAPEHMTHPLGSGARDEEFNGDPHAAWTEGIHAADNVANCALVRYCSGLELPTLAAQLDDDCAKSKLKKRWKETLAGGGLKLNGLPCVSAAVRDALVGAGVDAEFAEVELSDTNLDEVTEFFLMTPKHVVSWIDWAASDVGLLWNGIYDEYFDLEPTAESYEATTPVVRIEGSNLVLVHESISDLLTPDAGFRLRALHECAVARNQDDCVRAT